MLKSSVSPHQEYNGDDSAVVHFLPMRKWIFHGNESIQSQGKDGQNGSVYEHVRGCFVFNHVFITGWCNFRNSREQWQCVPKFFSGNTAMGRTCRTTRQWTLWYSVTMPVLVLYSSRGLLVFFLLPNVTFPRLCFSRYSGAGFKLRAWSIWSVIYSFGLATIQFF